MSGTAETQLWLLEAVDQYEQPLTRYARRLLGDLDLAADAVQHAFVALCGESRSHVGDRVAPWLFRVCRNRVVDHLRRSGREQSLTGHEAASEHTADAGPPTTDTSIDPAIVVEHADLAKRLRELMRELPSTQRETIDLWCEGFTYREIATITGRQEGHVRVLAHRGLTALRQHPHIRCLMTESASTPSAGEHAPHFHSHCPRLFRRERHDHRPRSRRR
jgi:RNA polymerase sigma-70 factor (ECF subfamily)